MEYRRMIAITATMALPPHFALAQDTADYPTKPVRLIVATVPGSGSDIQARSFAQKMTENLKRPFIVDNRPGAGDTIGTGLAAKSPPDGYTLLVVTPSFTLSRAVHPSFPHDPITDFAPISLLVKAPYILLTHPSLPVKSVKELIALARAKPGALDLGAGSKGSLSHLGTAWFASLANIKATIIPYKGAAEVMTDVMAGRIHGYFGTFGVAMPHVKSGRLRALGVSSTDRSSVLPELATISESGVRGFDLIGWNGWVAPAGTPAAIVNKLSAELAKAVRSADLTRKLPAEGGEAVGSTPEQFQQLIASEVSRWSKVVKDFGNLVE